MYLHVIIIASNHVYYQVLMVDAPRSTVALVPSKLPRASRTPFVVMASAILRMSLSLTVQPNLVQLFQPIGGVSGESVVEQWRTLWRQQRITERRQQRLRVAMLSHAIAASATMETTRRLVRCKARSDVRIALRTEARSDVRIGLRDEARSDVRIALRDEAGCMQPHSKECADSQECTAGFVPRAEHRAPPAQFRTTGASPETFARSFGATIHAGPVTCERLPAPLV